MRLRKKARQQETERVNEEQRRALEAPSAAEKVRMAKLEDEMEKQNARNMVRSYLEEQGLV
jgi:trehalose-6-phosphate synthase